MGWRYRKSVTLFPGVRVNFGTKSASLSLGGKGFRTTYSTTGRVTKSFGIPGTGLSYVTSTNRKKNSSASPRSRTNTIREAPATSYTAPTTLPPTPEYTPVQEVDHRSAAMSLIEGIYETADAAIDWRKILVEDYDADIPHWDYLRARAERVLNGDLETYFEIISDMNPVDDLLRFGSEFECGTEDPRMLSVHFKVNSSQVLRDIKHLPKSEYNELLQDYVCGCAIRVARDLFALLPFRRVVVDAENHGKDILSVEFTREKMTDVDYETIDASEFVTSFTHRMDFTPERGFSEIVSLDSL